MNFEPSEEHELIRSAVQKVCADLPGEYWATCDAEHEFPWAFYDAMAAADWIGIAIPEAYGGSGRGITEASIVLGQARRAPAQPRLLRRRQIPDHDLRLQTGDRSGQALVEESVIRADPNRTLIPGMIVDAVVVEPWGCHPSYAHGRYDRDNDFYVAWEDISRDPARLQAYLDEFVYGVRDRAEYMARNPGLAERLKASSQVCAGVNYGF